MQEHEIARDWLQACLSADATPGTLAPPEDADTLDLSRREPPDLRFADAEDLAALLAHPVMGQLAHLRLAEGARFGLEGILDACVRPLVSLSICSTEAFSGAIPEALPLIARHPATHALKTLRLELVRIRDLKVLLRAPLPLETLSLVGDLPARELGAISARAPALQRVRHLTLTPDQLTPAKAAAVAALPVLEMVTLPLIQSSGLDWCFPYDTRPAFLRAFPQAVQVLRARLGDAVRITAPGPEPLPRAAPFQAMLQGLGGIQG